MPKSRAGPQPTTPSQVSSPDAVIPSQRIPGSQSVWTVVVMVITAAGIITVFILELGILPINDQRLDTARQT